MQVDQDDAPDPLLVVPDSEAPAPPTYTSSQVIDLTGDDAPLPVSSAAFHLPLPQQKAPALPELAEIWSSERVRMLSFSYRVTTNAAHRKEGLFACVCCHHDIQ